jgi:hypothetical protein
MFYKFLTCCIIIIISLQKLYICLKNEEEVDLNPNMKQIILRLTLNQEDLVPRNKSHKHLQVAVTVLTAAQNLNMLRKKLIFPQKTLQMVEKQVPR